MEIVNLLMVGVLIALTAFFVASEFAIVKVRSTRIDQLIAEGNRNARAAKRVISNLDEYLSACQLGITITALGLGWLGEPTVEHLLHPVFERINLNESVASFLSFAIAFATITFLHVVVGELAPKTLAIQKAETITLLCSRPLIFFYKIMYPFIWALNGSARVITGLFGLKPASEHEVAHSEEELRLILSESYKSGEINQSEYKYVNNIFEFDNRIAKEIMVPRTEIVALDKNRSIAEHFETIKQEKYTRYPVIDGDKDHIVGMVNIKEILTDCIQNPKATEKKLDDYIRPIIQVIESIPIHDLLVKMQRERVHMAILVDEYGGTAGLVTVEDILEEIVGEIQDEFDIDEVPMIRKVNEHTTIVDGKVLIEDINDLLGTDIDDTDVDTIGGWILTEKFDIQQGDTLSYGDYEFKVLKMEGRHVQLVEITKRAKNLHLPYRKQ
ncbi:MULTISPECIES: hemolysin family protein [Geobacillus]|uniref:hemolysin family protein n=1 Tax=Geobacillus TaxID=129337 RepID=UPI00064A8256|nr:MULTISPECIES: hemolysin family protein [Geobacillus]AKU25524.1 membrane protein [Geobacillus sp. LC300]MED0653254.1 hemolysin family protein [Anoxybacillus geothermalis]MDF9298476.1 hemolysin family protein [Geobacillus stearothermophilus]NNV00339.1 HlyC/CorC family transporter [Geobacillus sp. DSP4a]QOR83115.1 HlyC/CorC family transporter [Geobacillus stearothermophilus]